MGRATRVLGGLVLLAAAGAGLLAWAAGRSEVAPRRVAVYLEQRATGHADLPGDATRWLARTLERLDRGVAPLPLRPALRLGAQPVPAAAAASAGRAVLAINEAQLEQALQQAKPGDVITLVPGTYRFSGRALTVDRPGTAAAPITLRAEPAGAARLEFALAEGFHVSVPYWTFENLDIRGVCSDHSACEHAFHVVGGAHHFTARNNTLSDFNAHFKINADKTAFPDRGRIEGNTLSNTAPRRTANPVTPIDLVAASHWLVRGNLITDFVRADSDAASYGAFAKGAGEGNRFERNIVLCEHRLRGQRGARVGLSLGGGGTTADACRDKRCVVEHDAGVIEANLIAFCSDSGIDINRASRSRVLHNTLIDTGGISVRSPAASAEVEGNLVDGALFTRLGGSLHPRDNLDSGPLRLFLGSHPQRDLFVDVAALDFAWRAGAPRRAGDAGTPADLCGTPRPAQPAYGAFEDFAACLAAPR